LTPFALLALAAAAAAPPAATAPESFGFPTAARVLRVPSSRAPLSVPPPPASDDAALRVAVLGEGPPVLLLPGLFGSAFGYRTLAPELAAAGFRAIALEPLGVGGSARPEGADYSLAAQAARIAALLPALGAERPVVVVHSAAAAIAFRLAARHPERVAAIVSMEGGAPEQAATAGFRRALTFAPLIRLLGGRRLIRRQVRSTLLGGAADKRWVTDEVVDGYMGAAAQDLGAALRGYRRMANAREPEPLAPRLRDVRCPVRLLMGAVPHRGGPDEAEIARLRQSLPTLVVQRLAGVGHYIYEEDPHAVVAAVREVTDAALPRAAPGP
jgi:pimeloyl-ACP methyl ester carboxylesterase